MPTTLIVTVLLFLLGLVLIVKGGDFFVDAAVWMAEASGVPRFLIGATIVSLATTLPELMVSIMGVLRGEVDLAIGNAVGSVTANTGLIMAISVICIPAVIRKKEFRMKGLLLIAASGLLWMVCRHGQLTILSSLLLLAVFLLFIWENVRAARDSVGGGSSGRSAPDKGELPRQLVKFLLGIIGIVAGADLLIDNGSSLALQLGVPASIVGVTVIAIGTSLPELVTTLTAIVKRESNLSIGNIVGANIIDLTLILPVCSLISQGKLAIGPQSAGLDLPVCFGITLLGAIPPLVTGKFYRWQGVVMMAAYVVYLVVLVG